jgi:hypothetical protein
VKYCTGAAAEPVVPIYVMVVVAMAELVVEVVAQLTMFQVLAQD